MVMQEFDTSILTRRIIMRLMREAGRRNRGTWHDIDQGRGGSISAPAPRRQTKKALEQQQVSDYKVRSEAGELWDAMRVEQRKRMMRDQGYDRDAVEDMCNIPWAEIAEPELYFQTREQLMQFARDIIHWS